MIYPIQHIPDCIPLGIQTEKGVQEIGFDVKPWLDAWDGLELAVYPTRPGEDAAYPAADVELIGTVLYWYPNDADTAIAGEGKVEIVGITADKRKLSGATRTVIAPTSMTATQEPPDTIKPFYDSIIHAGHEAKVEAAKYAGEAAAHAQEASASAETAGTYLGKVDASAKSAAAAAQEAKQSETAAASSAESAEKAKAEAISNADDAEEAAKSAQSKAQAAGTLATQAADSASSAATSAKNAAESAQAAKQSKTEAGASAQAASESAAAADASARKAAQAAGNSALYTVNVTWDETIGAWVSDRTQEEITEASAAGKACILLEPLIGLVMPLVGFRGNAPQFVLMENDATLGLLEHRAVINTDKTVDIYGTEVKANPPLPDLTTTGYLRWNRSAWEAVNIAQLKADLGL